MDYCHPCRRHLSGALACPGCGTPVETLRAHPEGPAAPQAAYEEDVPEPEPEPAPHAEPEPAEGARRPTADDGGPASPRAADEGPPGRVSRRDRKAAAHRRRRRRSLLVAAGFVLAAGALSLAELGMDVPGSKPEPTAGDETPDGGSAKAESAPPPGGAPGTGASVNSPVPSISGSLSASKSPTDEESAKAEEEAEGAEGEPEEDTGSVPADTSPPDPTAAPPQQSPPQPGTPEPGPTTPEPEPEPEPEPSETCDRFLWWCT